MIRRGQTYFAVIVDGDCSELKSKSMRFLGVAVLAIALAYSSITIAIDVSGYLGCFKHDDGVNLWPNPQAKWIQQNSPIK